jgi:hypothetical protein
MLIQVPSGAAQLDYQRAGTFDCQTQVNEDLARPAV